MTYIAEIEFTNWMRYGGAHRVALAPEIYAVESRWHDDDDRSNWGGKTAFVSTIKFALFGEHPHSGQGAGSEDAWITNGQTEGVVKLTLSTGHRIERSRKRGSSTRVELHTPGAAQPAIGDAAQREIEALLGLGKKDFESTLYIGQGEASSFVTNTEERQNMVLDWGSLRPLQKSAKRASDALSAAVEKRESIARRITANEGVIASSLPVTLAVDVVCKTPDEIENAILTLSEEIKERQGTRDVLRRRREERIRWESLQHHLAQTAKFEEDAKRAEEEAARLRALVTPTVSTTEAMGAHQQALAQLNVKRRLAAGRFDGQCPVGSCECPITDALNAAREANAKACEEAAQVEREARALLEAQQKKNAQSSAEETAAHRAESRAAALREQAKRAAESKPTGPAPEAVPDAELLQVEQAITALTNHRAKLQTTLDLVRATQVKIDADRAEEKKLSAEIVELRGSAVALGRSGAQRVIGQRMVRAIEEGANSELARCGVKLVVRVPWEREGADKAKECDACGAPFRDGRAKECPSCGAVRGKQLILGPFVSLSDRSGAAMALAGFTLRLAAASWLRQKRSSAWGTVVLDEVFGALDKTHRSAVASHLVTMLRGRHGFEQAFVISHERGTLDAMPARIIVRAGPQGSALEVSR